MAIEEYYLVCGPNGGVAPDGTMQPEGIAVGHILYDPEHEYTPPEGLLLVHVAAFKGEVYRPAPRVVVPASVETWKLQVVLLGMPGKNGTLLDDANALAAKVGGIAAIAWAGAKEIDRAAPLLAQMASELGLGDADLDAIFLAAADIRA